MPAVGDPAEGSGTIAAAAAMAGAAAGSRLRSSSGSETAHTLSQEATQTRSKGQRSSVHQLVSTKYQSACSVLVYWLLERFCQEQALLKLLVLACFESSSTCNLSLDCISCTVVLQ